MHFKVRIHLRLLGYTDTLIKRHLLKGVFNRGNQTLADAKKSIDRNVRGHDSGLCHLDGAAK